MQNTQSFLNILISMRQNQFTQDDIWQYCLEHTSDLSDNLKQLSKYTRENIHGAQMLSEKMVTKLLQFFVFATRARVCVDVGTFTAMSAIAMAEAAPDTKVYTIDRANQVGEQLAKEFIAKYPNIEYCQGNAMDILPTLPNQIDIAFIDADKKQTQEYFDILITKLADTGVIIVDDILWRGEVLDPRDKRAKALDDFNKYVNQRNDLETLVLPIRHGINIIRKRT
ncbi:O-methyltransferase [Francisella tularensis]|uniref:O-methyltransferase n=1 Tax=Francisella tularensis TaxID=263 RepID=UPI00018554B9|nr:class I SAM-dependent methyltransferase [Francisella tularensis]EDZ90469.1 O-methyltransferase family protein [Francisella tularensis subsp. novicida FTG]MBK2335194.1 class I SAM-dependent methyltransferase [Francisella tularensis subsp. novicida]